MALRRVLVYVRKARLKSQPCFDLFSIVMQKLVRKLEGDVLLRGESKREGSLCELFDKL